MIDNLGQDQFSSIILARLSFLTGKFIAERQREEMPPDVDISLMILTMWHLFI